MDSKHSFSFGQHFDRANTHLSGRPCTSLATGDAVRFTATGGQKVTATEPAEILVREMHASVAA